MLQRDGFSHLDRVHMAKAPTWHASLGLLQRSAASPSHSTSDCATDSTELTRQTDTCKEMMVYKDGSNISEIIA